MSTALVLIALMGVTGLVLVMVLRRQSGAAAGADPLTTGIRGLRNVVKSVSDGAGSLFGLGVDVAVEPTRWVYNNAVALGGDAVDVAGDVGNTLGDVGGAVAGGVGDVGNAIGSGASSVYHAIKFW